MYACTDFHRVHVTPKRRIHGRQSSTTKVDEFTHSTNIQQVFSLDYQPPAPLSAIIHSCALSADYARIFHLLWRIKRVEWSLAASWK